MYWTALVIAIFANIISNLALKASVLSIDATTPLETLTKVAVRPLFWVGILFAGILFASYVFALRQIELSVAYVVVTVSVVVGISIISVWLFHESMGLYKVLGILLVLAGLTLVCKAA